MLSSKAVSRLIITNFAKHITTSFGLNSSSRGKMELTDIHSEGSLQAESEQERSVSVSYKALFFGHRNLIKNKAQTAVINMVNQPTFITNLTFCMLSNIHFQK